MIDGRAGTGRAGPAERPPAERMTDIEAFMWRLGEHDPRLRSTMSMLVGFDRVLDRRLVRERLDEVTRRVPLLRHRVARGGFDMTPPRWEPDPGFSIDHHLNVARSAVDDLAPDGGLAMRVAEDVISAPLPAGRPPWRAVLVPGPTDALVLHLHHSYTDGMGGVRLLGELFDRPPGEGRAEADSPPPDSPPPGPPPSFLAALGQDLQSEMRRSAGLARWALPWAWRSLTGAARDPESVLRAAGEVTRAAAASLAGPAGPASPVLRDRSAEVRLAHLELPLSALRRTGTRIGGTVNDVFLGIVLEGLARYHEKSATLPASLRLGIPISSRGDGSDGLGMHNQLYGAILRGPLGPLDFDERTRLVGEMVKVARGQPWLGLIEEAAGVGLRWPGAVAMVARALRSLDVLASNVVGPPEVLSLGGARVEQMVPFGPRSGAALNVTLLSYAGRAHLGLNIDPAAVAGIEVLIDCLRATFEEHAAS